MRSRRHDHYATPHYVVKALRKVFGKFNFDPCPLHHDLNKWDGLKVSWGSSNFVNPPYTQKLKEEFFRHAVKQWTEKGHRSVFLIPVSTSTAMFHNDVLRNADNVMFVKGRIKFFEHGKPTEGAGFRDSMVIVIGDYFKFGTAQPVMTIEFVKKTADCIIRTTTGEVVMDTRKARTSEGV